MRVSSSVTILVLAVGCGPYGDAPCDACDSNAESDTDTDLPDTDDTDADTDTDGDTDTDVDADGDTDVDTDTDPPVTCDTTVVPDEPCLVAADGTGTYLTIQEAVDAATEGDVITVCPGYYDSVVIDRGITLAGYGADSTCIVGTDAPGITIQALDVEISGFTVSGRGDALAGGAIHGDWGSATLHDLRVAGVEPNERGSFAAVWAFNASLTIERVTFEVNGVDYAFFANGALSTIIRHSLFRENVTGVQYSTFSSTDVLELTNCLFIANTDGLHASGNTGQISNNVAYANGSGLEVSGGLLVRNNVALSNIFGFSGTYYDIDYNVGWDSANKPDFWATAGPHDVSVDPMFEDPANGDFRLKPGSPLIDAGDPDPAHNDPDGSRNDIGIYGGPYGSWTPP